MIWQTIPGNQCFHNSITGIIGDSTSIDRFTRACFWDHDPWSILSISWCWTWEKAEGWQRNSDTAQFRRFHWFRSGRKLSPPIDPQCQNSRVKMMTWIKGCCDFGHRACLPCGRIGITKSEFSQRISRNQLQPSESIENAEVRISAKAVKDLPHPAIHVVHWSQLKAEVDSH